MRSAAVAALLAALLAASLGVTGSKAAFTARTLNPGSTFTAAADWVAPTVTLTAPADGAALSSTSVVVSGAAGNATGDSTTVVIRLYSGAAPTGTPLLTRNVTRTAATWTTTVTGLTNGSTYTARATQTDTGGNAATTTANTFTVDTAAPTAASISAANGATTTGSVETGDTITYTFSEAIAPASVLTGFTGSSTAVTVKFFNGSPDRFTVLDSAGAANVRLDAGTTGVGGVTTGGANYVTNTVVFGATMTQSADKRSFTILLGTPDRPARLVATQAAAANMAWTPRVGPIDLAGNALTTTAVVTETDADRDF